MTASALISLITPPSEFTVTPVPELRVRHPVGLVRPVRAARALEERLVSLPFLYFRE